MLLRAKTICMWMESKNIRVAKYIDACVDVYSVILSACTSALSIQKKRKYKVQRFLHVKFSFHIYDLVATTAINNVSYRPDSNKKSRYLNTVKNGKQYCFAPNQLQDNE